MDFINILRAYYSDPRNTRNPLTKRDLINTVPNVLFHRTIANDETMSVPKDPQIGKIPHSLRLTTICVITCSIRRKKGFTIDFFLSEIIYADSNLFRRHFYHAGILMESHDYDECIQTMINLEAIWPDRRGSKVVDISPTFQLPFPTPKGFRERFLHVPQPTGPNVDINEWERYIQGLPCILAPLEPTPDWVPPSGIYWADMLDDD